MQVGSGEQVPGEAASVQVMHASPQAVSQQTPWAPHTPVAHSSVDPQVAPGVFWVWQFPLTSQ